MSRTSLAPNINTIAPIQLGLDSLLEKFVVDLADTQFDNCYHGIDLKS